MNFCLSLNGVALPISPLKINVIANVIRHQRLDEAICALSFSTKKGAVLLRKLLMSFDNSLKSQQKKSNDFFLSRLEIGKGYVLKRMIYRAKGVSNKIKKRSSIVYCTIKEGK